MRGDTPEKQFTRLRLYFTRLKKRFSAYGSERKKMPQKENLASGEKKKTRTTFFRLRPEVAWRRKRVALTYFPAPVARNRNSKP